MYIYNEVVNDKFIFTYHYTITYLNPFIDSLNSLSTIKYCFIKIKYYWYSASDKIS